MKTRAVRRIAFWAVLLLVLPVFLGCREGVWVSAPAEPTQEKVTKTFPTPSATGFVATLPPTIEETPASTPTPAREETASPGENAQDGPQAGDVTEGKKVFDAGCSVCHPGGGQGVGPSLMGIGDRMGDQGIASLIRQGRGLMPGLSAGALSDQGLADLVAFLKTLR